MEEFLPGLVKMIEDRIGAWFATIIVWVISITVLVGGLYYTTTFTKKLSKIISPPLARLLQPVASLVRTMQARPGVHSAVRVAGRISGPLTLGDFVFILLQVLQGIGTVIIYHATSTRTRFLPFLLIFQGAAMLFVALKDKRGSIKQ